MYDTYHTSELPDEVRREDAGECSCIATKAALNFLVLKMH